MSTFEKCIFILADGARHDVLAQLAEQGKLPNISHHMLKRGHLGGAVASFPTVSGAAHLPFMTGRFSGRLNVAGIYWFDRAEYARLRPSLDKFRTYLYFFKIDKMNRDVAADAVSIFELFKKHAGIFTWFSRGGTWDANMTRLSKITSFLRGYFTKNWLRCDLEAEEIVFKALKKKPDLIFAVFPAIDELSHRHNPLSETATGGYLNLDGFIGRLFDKLGPDAEKTLVVISSDHGQSCTHTHIDLEGLVRQNFKKTMSYKPYVTDYFSIDSVVMPSGNGMANLYFRGERWGPKRPDMTDTSKPWGRFVEQVLAVEGIDIVAFRDPQDRVVIRSPRGRAEAYFDNGFVRYIVPERDPFGFGKLPDKMTMEEALKLTFETDYPDGIVGMLTHLESARSGDLIVTSKLGFDLRDWWEYQEPHGTHGSLQREHSMVPVVTNAPLDDTPMRTVDVFPTLLRLTGRSVPSNVDGIDRSNGAR